MGLYKQFEINGKEVKCFDANEGFVLDIDNKIYIVYPEADGTTHVDEATELGIPVWQSEKEYLGKINDQWTGNEKEAAKWIINNQI